MSSNPRSAVDKLGALSTDKAKLLRLMLRRRSGSAQLITPHARFIKDGKVRLPASYGQQRLWFIDQLEEGFAAYHVALALRLRGSLNENALPTALNEIVQRHEALRTTFVKVEGGLQQEIAAHRKFPLKLVDLSCHDETAREAHVLQQKGEEFAERFDLSRGPLVRGRLLRLSAQEHVLLVTMHHIVSDGWSVDVFLDEFAALYSAFHNGHDASLAPLSIQYGDYSQWHPQWLHGEMYDQQLSYWKARLLDSPPQIELPTDRSRPAVQSYRGGNVRFVLNSELSERLRELAQSQEMTLFMVLVAGWTLLLSRLSLQDDVVVGTPVANRQHTQVERLIGFFVNTLALRVTAPKDLRVGSFLDHVKDVTLGAYAHQDLPFEKVVEAVQPQRSLGRNPVFQVMFAMQSAPRNELRLPGMTATVENAADEPSLFDLLLLMQECGGEISGHVNFAADLFDHVTVARWTESFTVMLDAITRGLDTPLGELPILPPAQYLQVVESFNATDVPFPRNRTVNELFEEQVEKAPHALIVEHEGESITYMEFNQRANQLAHYLRDRGVIPGAYVPIIMSRSLQMLIAEVAVLKCGGAYVPVDPTLPAERQTFIIQDCGSRMVLAQGAMPADLAGPSIHWVDCSESHSAFTRHSTENLQRAYREDPAAYVMYTSGSTGTPKGVVVPHRAINRLVVNADYVRLSATDCIAHISNPAFDASTFEIWGALLNGARLLIVPSPVVLDPVRFAITLKEHRVTVLWITVGLLTQYVDALSPVFAQLRYVITGGDVVEPSLVRRVLRYALPRRLVNAYGPTECTTFATTYLVEALDDNASSLPIGSPISNTKVYVLDSYGRPVPIGVTGELYIGGPGVALEYLNRRALTEQRFVADSFSGDPQARLYRTGDLGRWRADGNIEFRGRNDQQVKIRGYRIELGEIEECILKHPDVNEAVVLAREEVPGQKRLVAYITGREKIAGSAEELRSFLRAALPEYMLPSAYVFLERLPLNASGKVDRHALQAPQVEAYASRPFEPPHGEVEEVLAETWQQLLQVQRVGRRDNFFELGGHSLLMVQMMEKLRRAGLHASVRSIYETSTLADLALTLSNHTAESPEPPANLIPPGCATITPAMLSLVQLEFQHIARIVDAVPGGARNIQDIYPLAPLQEGILFHHLLDETGVDPYVLPTLLEMSSREKLDAFITGLQAVINRHDILRTAVLWEQLPLPVQVVCRRVVLPVEELVLDRDANPVQQMAARMGVEHRRLNLRHAPLIWLQVAADPHGTHWYVLLHMHHVVCDHESHDLMFSEIIAHLEGREHELPAPLPYRNHVAQALAQVQARDAEAFFRTKLADVDEPTVPFGLVDARAGGIYINQAHETLSDGLAQRVRALARRLAVSPATLFHAAWALVLSHTSGRDDVVFGSVLLGRLQGSAGAQRTLGMFINTLPLRLQLHGVSAKELVQLTHRELMELLSHEQASLAVAQRCTAIPGAASPFTTLLNYRHSGVDMKAELASVGVSVLAHRSWTNYPIMVAVDDLERGFALSAKTDRRIDPQRLLRQVATAVRSLVDALENAPQSAAVALVILPDSERQEVLQLFNATQADYPRHSLVHELFEQQVERCPEAIALEHNGHSLSYAELNRRANQLARHLRDVGVSVGALVGICVERCPDMVVGLLASLKAGAAYLPLDPNYPAERLQYMLEDSALRVVLTQQSLRATLPAMSAPVIVLDTLWQEIPSHSPENLSLDSVRVSPTDAVYVIYTSGSTGRPKGTEMPHRAMVNLISWHRATLPCQTGERVLQFAALSFDVAFQEMFSTLCLGGTVVLLDEPLRRDPQRLMDFLDAQRISRLFLPPLMLQSLAESFKSTRTSPAALRDIITAGEQLRISTEIVDFLKGLNGARLHNHYGPTETHVVTALTLARDPDSWPELPSIGRPIANTQIYVLDPYGQPAPIGVAGEIFIAGTNVARGYRGRPELTTQRFLPDPFNPGKEARMYKTGDLGRWNVDGSVEYLGRNDDQVKIRGYRIELGEVEAQLARHPLIKHSVVVARDDAHAGKRLIAYLIADSKGAPTVEELRDHVRDALPEHMVPSAFVFLQTLPLTTSGKIDRQKLPAPDLHAYSVQEYEAPQGTIEQSLAEIWRTLLRVERVGRHDNFFELGGHSLLAMKLVVRVADILQANIAVPAVFRFPTVHDMAQLVESVQVSYGSSTIVEGADLDDGFV